MMQAMFETLPCEVALIRRGATWRDRIALTRINARLHLQAGLRARLGRVVPMGRVRLLDVEIDGVASLRLRSNDVVVFEVLGCEAYGVDLSLLDGVETVLDAGANVGLATVYLSTRLPGARFCCVEPAPETFALLEENLRRNVPNAQALNAALTGERGRVAVEKGENAGLTITHLDARGAVEGLTIADALDRAGFARADLLKLDIQGGEADLLQGSSEWAPRVRALIAEIHAPLTVDDAAAALAPYGFAPLPLPGGRLFDDMLYARHV
jgi:FkbM family methyltransferase